MEVPSGARLNLAPRGEQALVGVHPSEREIKNFDDLCSHPCERKAAFARADVIADDRQRHRPSLAHENAWRGQTGKHRDTDLAESDKTRLTGAA